MDTEKIKALKARGYDLISTIERCQQQLQQINAEIARELQSQPPLQAVPKTRAERRREKKSA